MSIFQSHIRFHGCPPKFREPWNFSEEAQITVRKFLELRYKLIPYIFSESVKAAGEGLPFIRPLFLEYPNDPMCRTIEDQFFSGEKLLIAPVLTEMNNRRIYLPEGLWYNFWSGERVHGPVWIEEESPLDRIPVYIKAGTFLPMGEDMQFISDALPQKLRLLAFLDDEKSLEYTLYDEKGSIQFTGKLKEDNLDIEISCQPPEREKPEIEIDLPDGFKKNIVITQL